MADVTKDESASRLQESGKMATLSCWCAGRTASATGPTNTQRTRVLARQRLFAAEIEKRLTSASALLGADVPVVPIAPSYLPSHVFAIA